ncbi:hypothetical protein [Cupriavidus sp. D39]|uniref:hypothetical protein n=1 Tax=Cupriavidus sp. D39 TaxID=2997877 RepID=UPI00226E7830|nr:hypothetical protein [Cupriavidus sp. D39]MCY0856245.1 hypothetical protein [Cupriavidus sp. D39]
MSPLFLRQLVYLQQNASALGANTYRIAQKSKKQEVNKKAARDAPWRLSRKTNLRETYIGMLRCI